MSFYYKGLEETAERLMGAYEFEHEFHEVHETYMRAIVWVLDCWGNKTPLPRELKQRNLEDFLKSPFGQRRLLERDNESIIPCLIMDGLRELLDEAEADYEADCEAEDGKRQETDCEPEKVYTNILDERLRAWINLCEEEGLNEDCNYFEEELEMAGYDEDYISEVWDKD